MRNLLVVAILLVASSAARAETFSFVIGGQAIHIGISSGCSDLSCVSVDVAGSRNRGSRKSRQATQHHDAKPANISAKAKTKPKAPVVPATRDEAATEPTHAKAAMVQEAAPVPQTRSIAPAQAPAAESNPTPMAAEPPVANEPAAVDEPKTLTDRAPLDAALGAVVEKQAAAPAATVEPKLAAEPEPLAEAAARSGPKSDTPTVIAALPPPKPDDEPVVKPAAATAIGMWSGSDGQLRIEPCGRYLCGYAASGKHAGKLVLINMRQTKGNAWTGRVHDFKSGGTYSARMTLRGATTLRVEGCAFGGMICDGRTLARVN